LNEVVVEAREGLDVEQSPAAADRGGMRATHQRIGEAEARREVGEVGVDAALGKSGIAGEEHAGGRLGKTLRPGAWKVAADLPGDGVGPRDEGIPAQAQVEG